MKFFDVLTVQTPESPVATGTYRQLSGPEKCETASGHLRQSSDLIRAIPTYSDQKNVKTAFCVLLRPPVQALSPHTTAQFPSFFAPMCTCVHLRAPSCGKMKKSKQPHK